MHLVRSKWFWLGLLLIAILTWMLWSKWQGPRIEVYEVQQQALVQTVVASGRVENVARSQIGAELAGVVLERKVNEGDVVQQGDLLLVIRSDELEAQVQEARSALNELRRIRYPQAQLDLTLAETQYQQALRETERRRQLEVGSISKEEIEKAQQQAKVAKQNMDTLRLKAKSLAPNDVEEQSLQARLNALEAQRTKRMVRAPQTGTILTRQVEIGDLVQAGQLLFTLAVEGPTQIRVPVDEQNLPRLALGQTAHMIADAYPAQSFKAQLGYIAPSVDAQRGTVELKLAVNDVPDYLKQDMTVSMNLETARVANTIVLPNSSLEQDHRQQYVWKVVDDRLKKVVVTTGLQGTTETQIVKGINAGDWVVLDANRDLKPDARVRPILKPSQNAKPPQTGESP